MGELVVAATVASAGLKVASGIGAAQGDYLRGMGESASLQHRAQEAARSARAGKVAAMQTDTHFQEELHTTLANMSAIRASSGVGSSSPTTDAIRRNEARVSDRERRIRTGNIRAQSESDRRASSFLSSSSGFARHSARHALTWGTVGAFGDGLGTLAGR